jgi:hypothetical protein
MSILSGGTSTAAIGVMRGLLATSAASGGYDIDGMFRTAKKEAKVAGKLLACVIAMKGLPELATRSINLIAFSLGTQVTKSCI